MTYTILMNVSNCYVKPTYVISLDNFKYSSIIITAFHQHSILTFHSIVYLVHLILCPW